ncbi:MAG TPA: alpha/beta fold hydrolase [Galbitalea sp.]|jgi:pimeloyl-ACP methyl ester carboxylesterase|nr:alpha/beta fold hydrolase [Galbitalea sp.]
MAHHYFELESGRKLGISALGEPTATRLVVLCLPTPGAGPFDPDPEATIASGVRVIEIDRPGYGGSDPLPNGTEPTVEGFADDIAEYLQRVERVADEITGIQFGTVGIVGWSFGGAIATSFAARHPQLTDCVVIIGSPDPHTLRKGQRYSAISELRKHGIEKSFNSLRASIRDDGPPSLFSLGVDGADPALAPLGVRGRLERMLENAWMQDGHGIAADRLAVRTDKWADVVGRLDVPALLLYGCQDAVASESDAKWYAKRFHDPVIMSVPDEGHLVLLTHWHQVLEFVTKSAH